MQCVKSGVGDVKSTVEFTINGIPYTVDKNILPGTSLNVYIRDHAMLRGTKAMCHEGGCGACIVSVTVKGVTMSVNSCLVPVLICQGWAIKTIEGLGNQKDGYHILQSTLAHKNGSQCGYCSPGMVMNMYSLIQDGKLTMKEIENSFGSNICRCTGYRPILDAFKSFASDAPKEMIKEIHDIEELYKMKICKRTGEPCQNGHNGCVTIADQNPNTMINIKLDGSTFYKVLTVDSLFEVFRNKPDASYVLHGGNTAHGVYRLKVPDMYIDINDISDLRRISKESDTLTIGGNVSLTVAMDTFNKYSKESKFEYLQHLASHIDLIASVPVRNIGTLAGNLMIKHQYREFPSDLFLMFETAGAQIHVLDAGGKKSLNCLDFLKYDMKHKLIYSIVLPALGSEYSFRSFKIMPRAQNAHAHVNAGFLLKLDRTGKVLEKPNIIFGGIHKDFLHATNTENFLIGKSVFNKDIVKQALDKLDAELTPDHVLPDYSPEFRKILAEGLFFKFLISLKSENVDPKIRTGGTILERGLSSGKQEYDTDKKLWPLNQPLPKIESAYQTSGEAKYMNDLPSIHNEVFCAFVLATVPNGKVESIDASEALKMKGVVAFFTGKDVPGKNLFIDGASQQMMLSYDEVLFADEKIEFNGQPVGVVAAISHTIANEAAEKVKVSYADVKQDKGIFNIEQVIASNDESRLLQTAHYVANTKGKDTKQVVKGVFRCGGQYHYTMEPQTCVCVPIEDGLDIYASSQHMDLIQTSVARLLNIPNNSINVNVRRLGGGYGGKISRATLVACACALVSYKLNRPARFIMSIESNMKVVGKRFDTRQEYEVGVDDNGKIQYLNAKIWGNAGCSFNEMHEYFTAEHMKSCYDSSTWSCDGFEARTDLPSNTYCRAPSSTEGVGMIENLMEHIARVVGKDPLEVRLANMSSDYKDKLQPMLEDLRKIADYDARKAAVESFNNENRWKKKGIALVPMMYPLVVWGQFNAFVAIYARDGTVSVTHGGIECGQGINTKVAQIAAHTLGIDLSMVTVKPSNNLTAPNNFVTGGSITSESCAFATMKSCQELLQRLEPIKKELNNPTWQELVLTAHQKNVDLCARYLCIPDNDAKSYEIHGVTIAEVEVDMLTGQHLVNKVDIIEDVGVSMNPEIDVGQVEGAFIMGLGFWTSEDLIYDPKTGALTNYRTWNYKPPGAKDIPVDFRVYFRNSSKPLSVLRSKATGEPPLVMSYAVPIAIRNALDSARKDAGNKDQWYRLDGPVTTEKILLNSLTNKEQMVL